MTKLMFSVVLLSALGLAEAPRVLGHLGPQGQLVGWKISHAIADIGKTLQLPTYRRWRA